VGSPVSTEFDWLDAPVEAPVVSVQKALSGEADKNADPRFHSLAADTRRLPMRQKLLLRSLLANQMHPARAIKAMNEALVKLGAAKVDVSTVYRWMRSSELQKLVERYSDLAAEAAGIGNVTTTMLRIDAIVEEALEAQPIVDRSGKVVGYAKDFKAALKGLEMLGKSQGAFREDEEDRRRVTVVLDFSGDRQQGEQESETVQDPIDGEFEEIKR
jgi:hypothetical protein